MLVYLATGAAAIALVAAAQYACNRRPRAARLLWVAAFAVLLAPAALRYDIGVDYSATMFTSGYLGYWQLYHLYAGQPPAPGMDPGFYLLIRVLNLFTDNPQWMFAIMSAATYALVLRACRRLSPSPVFSVTLFLVAGFYFESYNIARQWFAIVCVMNALEWVGDERLVGSGGVAGESGSRRSFVRYAAWVVLGATMHVSCLLWLAVWPLTRLRLTPRRACACLAGFLVLAFAGVFVVQTFFGQTRFGLYFDPSSPVYAGANLRVNAVVTAGFTWLFALVAPRLGCREDERGECAAAPQSALYSTLVLCATLTLAIDLSEAALPAIVDRVARYFAPMLILLMPRVLARVDDVRLRRIFTALIIVAWLAATYVQVVRGGQYGVVPYQSVFGELSRAGMLS